MRIGILEDQKLMRDTLEEAVRTAGFEVACSTPDAADFLEAVRRTHVDVAVVDLWLGGDRGKLVDHGWQALQQLRQWHPDVRVLVVSGQDGASVDDCIAAGAAGFVDKNTTSLVLLRDAVIAVAQGARVAPLAGSFHARPPTENPALRGLTQREIEILRLVATGADNMKIAALLEISERTVRAHVSNLYKKLAVENRAQMAILARKLGVLPLEV